MKLKKITLNNIRSYESQEIVFPEGSVLLSGDIGSGKTSILLGIEFALFGLQPGQRGSSLLKNGKSEGGVVINFEVEGQDVIIERTLKKNKTISQDYCSITVDGEKEEISVTEIKDRVLEILNYPKEFAKKQNLLYKFTVYTPQEEMKQIILQDPETRINTLRHVFGIDKYKRILENVSILSSKLREEKRLKQAITENLEQDRLEIVTKENDLDAKYYNIDSVEKELFLKTEAKKRILEEREEVLKKVEEKKELEKEVEKTKIMIINKREAISNNFKNLERLTLQINELSSLVFEEAKIPQLEKQIEVFKFEKKEFNEKNLNVSAQINSLQLRNRENEVIKSKISNMEMCPTCLQDVDPSYRANVSNKLESETSQNLRKIEELNLEKKIISENLNRLDREISLGEKQVQDLKIIKVKLEELKEKKSRLKEIETMNNMLKKDIALLDGQSETIKTLIFDLNKFQKLYEEKQKGLENAMKEERIAEIKVAELRKEIEVFSMQIQELKERILKTEQIKKQLEYISELETWLSKKFSSLIANVEKNVMVKLKMEFSKLFSEWFSMLVAENFNVKLDNNFTPIVEQQDYEIDYAYLSGGERTAIALAYRLALNQVINSILSKIKTRDFVILDEPTDGFSEQQLDKMREVLEELNVAQLIIVSHEQKIEGFVENVIRFKKENGISGIAG